MVLIAKIKLVLIGTCMVLIAKIKLVLIHKFSALIAYYQLGKPKPII